MNIDRATAAQSRMKHRTQPSRPPVRSSELVRRFSDKQAELAAKISNDIAEDIDCGESRKSLRMAVAYWTDVACVESQRRANAESTVAIFKSAKALMDVVLPPNAEVSDGSEPPMTLKSKPA